MALPFISLFHLYKKVNLAAVWVRLLFLACSADNFLVGRGEIFCIKTCNGISEEFRLCFCMIIAKGWLSSSDN